MKFYKRLDGDNRGFTLIELIVTVIILALVTAPFLSSFVSAGKTNVKAKREQKAAELGEYITEQFKASSIDTLKTTYTLGDKKNALGDLVGYETTISNTNLPNGYSDRYSAKVTLVKSASAVNTDVTPVIENIQKETCAMFINNITIHDSENTSAYSRKCVIDITYDASATKKYVVSLSMSYLDSTGNLLKNYNNMAIAKYENLNSIYLLYLPMQNTDKIEVNNHLTPSQMKNAAGNIVKLNLYIVNQDATNPMISHTVSADKIFINEIKDDGTYNNTSLNGIKNGTNSINNEIIYTNTVVNDSTKLVKTESVATLYDMTVEVSYAGTKIATFTSSKSTVN